MQKFEDCLSECEALELSKSVLLGNGFSMDWGHETFNYQNLYDRADFGTHQESLEKLFEAFETYDFERVMRVLLDAQQVAESHSICNDLSELATTEIGILRNALINVITDSHPESSIAIKPQEYSFVVSFLANFNKYFTLNYDLLLYWVANEYKLQLGIDDGFRRPDGELKWCAPDKQNLFFLHGALHLFDLGNSIRKHTQIEHGRILDSVTENLSDDIFPLFVSEPSAELKHQKMIHNPYLNHCYRSLSEINGALFIFGLSFNDNDDHIFQALHEISEERLPKVFVGIFGSDQTPQNRKIIGKAISIFGNNNRVVFFDSGSANVWGNQSP